MLPAPDDDALMTRCRDDGDVDAFDLLAARYREPLRRHLRALVQTSDADAADDLLQETLLRVWIRASGWDGNGAVKAWLFRIATNLALNHLRTLQRRREQPLAARRTDQDDNDEETPAWMIDRAALGPDDLVLRADTRARLDRVIENLPGDKRDVIRQVYTAERDLREVADALGIPEGTVKSRLFHARKRLAEDLLREPDFEE